MAFRAVTLITGASSGIGAALARVFAHSGHDLVLVGRREAALNAVADKLPFKAAPPVTIAIDLTRADAGARLGHEIAARHTEPVYVVNNAGFGLYGQAIELDRAEQLQMIDLNVRALTDLSLRWSDSLTRNKGGILNVASVASFLPGPGMAVYYATKAYVLSFSEALHYELAPLGIRVTALCPGPVPTEFQPRAGLAMSRAKGILARSADQVAREGYEALMAGKRVLVPGFANRIVTNLPRLLSREAVLNRMGKHHRTPAKPSEPAPSWPRKK